MITLELVRFSRVGDQGIYGILTLPTEYGNQAFVTLELPWQDNHQTYSHIPIGTYSMGWTTSAHFPEGSFEIFNVPNREGIRLHNMNFAGDITKGWASDVEGCIGLGLDKGVLPCPSVSNVGGQSCSNSGQMQAAVLNSKQARMRFEELLPHDQGIQIVISESWKDEA